jgi:tripartite-type tricarboxylate transporter receptor subunit TctC
MRNKLKICLWIFCFYTIVIFAGTHSFAAQDTKNPIQIIVPDGAGSESDMVARKLADKMTELLGVKVAVKNISSTQVSNKKPVENPIGDIISGTQPNLFQEIIKSKNSDGSSILMIGQGRLILKPLVFPKENYDAEKDFSPISQLVSYPIAVGLRQGAPPQYTLDVKGYIEYAKLVRGNTCQDRALNASDQFISLTICKQIGDPFGFSINNRLIATSGPKIQGIPTYGELGYKGIDGGSWTGIVASPNTPKEIINKLNLTIVKAMHSPDIVKIVEGLGGKVTGTTSDEFGKIIKNDKEKWSLIVKKAGMASE